MRVTGVIAEYDPFHRGHAHHLKIAREASRADYVVAVMSCCFTQRGIVSLLPPDDRVRMALLNGADAVIALPAMWSVRDAEHFALGGVRLLQGIGCDAISFGCETDDLPLLQRTARMLEDPTPAMLAAIHGRLDHGLGYPAAVAAALKVVMPDAEALLSSPNNTLAIAYLRAMERLGASMDAVPVRREGSYHATALGEVLPSASAVRGAIRRGDWLAAEKALPDHTRGILRDAVMCGRVAKEHALSQALLYRLRTMSDDEWHDLPGLSEGIGDRLRNAAMQAADEEELFRIASSKRYPTARLRRLAAHALLGLTEDLLEDTPLPPAAWLLGFRNGAEPLVRAMSGGALPLLTRAADLPQDASWFQAEARAWDLRALACGMPSGSAFAHKLVKV